MKAAALSPVLLLVFAASLSARDDEKPATKAAPPDVVQAPPASEFFVVPLRVHILRSKELKEVDCALTDDDVRRILGKVNKVWSVAGIHFGLESIRREDAVDEEKFKKAVPEKGPVPLAAFTLLAPKDSREFNGQHVYYIHKFSVNGVYLGRATSFVQETAKLRPVPGGIDEPLPRVTAHELGHALGLPHRQNNTNLLASGTTGTLVNEAEVKRVRETAAKMKGATRYEDLKKSESEKGEATEARRKAWIEGVEALAAKKS